MIRRAHRLGALAALFAAVTIAPAVQAHGPGPEEAPQPPRLTMKKSAADKLAARSRDRGPDKYAPAPKPAPLTEADIQRRSQVVVQYAGGEVTIGELEDAIASQSPFMRERYRDPKLLKELVDKTLRFELLGIEAERRGLDKDDAVRQAVKQNAVQSLMKAEFDDKMSATAIPQAELAKYYQDHIDEYVQPAMQRASHVLVATEAEARELLQQAKAIDLRAFRQLARDKSLDEASKLRGGDLRYFDANNKELPAPVVKAGMALYTTGDVSQAIDAGNGNFYVLKQTGRRKQMTRSYEDAKPQIRNKLFREGRLKAQKEFIEGLRGKAKLDVNEQNLAKVRIDTSQNAAGDDGHGHDLAPPQLPAAPVNPPPPQVPAPAGSGSAAP